MNIMGKDRIMCNQITVLARESETRFIAQCEHETLHIAWDNLTLRLCPADFARVADMVEDAHARLKDGRGSNEGFRLKMRGLLLVFSLQDLTLLRKLTSRVMSKLDPGRVTDEPPGFELAPIESVSFLKSRPPYWQN
jgi:hypothetical protein